MINMTESPLKNILLTYRSLFTALPRVLPLPPFETSVHISFTSSSTLHDPIKREIFTPTRKRRRKKNKKEQNGRQSRPRNKLILPRVLFSVGSAKQQEQQLQHTMKIAGVRTIVIWCQITVNVVSLPDTVGTYKFMCRS